MPDCAGRESNEGALTEEQAKSAEAEILKAIDTILAAAGDRAGDTSVAFQGMSFTIGEAFALLSNIDFIINPPEMNYGNDVSPTIQGGGTADLNGGNAIFSVNLDSLRSRQRYSVILGLCGVETELEAQSFDSPKQTVKSTITLELGDHIRIRPSQRRYSFKFQEYGISFFTAKLSDVLFVRWTRGSRLGTVEQVDKTVNWNVFTLLQETRDCSFSVGTAMDSIRLASNRTCAVLVGRPGKQRIVVFERPDQRGGHARVLGTFELARERTYTGLTSGDWLHQIAGQIAIISTDPNDESQHVEVLRIIGSL